MGWTSLAHAIRFRQTFRVGSYPASEWPPEENVTIERLAFLAARPYLMHRANPWWRQILRAFDRSAKTAGFRGVGPGSGAASRAPGALPTRPWTPREPADARDKVTGERMRSYVCACELAASELSAHERVLLRQRGELPVWFWTALDEHALALRERA